MKNSVPENLPEANYAFQFFTCSGSQFKLLGWWDRKFTALVICKAITEVLVVSPGSLRMTRQIPEDRERASTVHSLKTEQVANNE